MMRSRRYLAEAIMEHWLVVDDEAYKLASLVQNVQRGDDLNDAVWHLAHNDDLPGALAKMRAIRDEITDAIDTVEEGFTPLLKRHASNVASIVK
jgi:hypothetical protein